MVFSNLVFLFVFLPVTIFLYYIVRSELRNYVLLFASLLFYAWGEPVYILVMLFSICMNYFFGMLLHYNKGASAKKWIVVFSVILNLSLLGVFKYADFFIQNINNLFSLSIPLTELSLPIGISFFTFQAMSYVIDVYRNDAKVQKSFFDLALYISLFPQLVAGPIVRYQTVADQIKVRQHTFEKFGEGVQRFLVGLVKKVFISNQLGLIADQIFATQASELSVGAAWLGILAYTLQIYFDFSGYSDMAIGLGKMFGFEFLENFNYPYISQSVAEFWRRWHISLGSWFRDYLYIPLGGNRVAEWKVYRNLFIVWTLTGFWHGASWTFLMWGLYFGIFIMLERAFLGKLLSKVPRVFRHVYLIFIVMIGWVFFRADNFTYSMEYIKVLFGFSEAGLSSGQSVLIFKDNLIIFLIAMITATPIAPYIMRKLNEKFPSVTGGYVFAICRGGMYMLLFGIVIMYLVNSTYNPFIYFRF